MGTHEGIGIPAHALNVKGIKLPLARKCVKIVFAFIKNSLGAGKNVKLPPLGEFIIRTKKQYRSKAFNTIMLRPRGPKVITWKRKPKLD